MIPLKTINRLLSTICIVFIAHSSGFSDSPQNVCQSKHITITLNHRTKWTMARIHTECMLPLKTLKIKSGRALVPFIGVVSDAVFFFCCCCCCTFNASTIFHGIKPSGDYLENYPQIENVFHTRFIGLLKKACLCFFHVSDFVLFAAILAFLFYFINKWRKWAVLFCLMGLLLLFNLANLWLGWKEKWLEMRKYILVLGVWVNTEQEKCKGPVEQHK